MKLPRPALLAIPAAGLLAGCGDQPAPLEPGPAALLVTVHAVGYPEAWRYRVLLDGEEIGLVRSGEILSTPVDHGGTYSLEVEVPEGCAVGEENPRSITIADGESVTADVAVDCAGMLRFTTATEGVNVPDGYFLLLNDDPPIPIGLDASLALGGMTARGYEVRLAGMTPNCVSEFGPTQSVYLEPRDTLALGFQVECLENAGSVEVTTVVATGTRSDFVVLALAGLHNIPPNATIVLGGLAAGYWDTWVDAGPECEAAITEGLVEMPQYGYPVLPIRDRETTRVTITVSC